MTAHAVVETSGNAELPVTRIVSALLKGDMRLADAIDTLLSRPLRRETENM